MGIAEHIGGLRSTYGGSGACVGSWSSYGVLVLTWGFVANMGFWCSCRVLEIIWGSEALMGLLAG